MTEGITKKSFILVLLVLVVGMLAVGTVLAEKQIPSGEPTVTPLAKGLEGASGSTIGPGGALYVTEGAAGRISRVDPQTGEITTFASGLPTAIIGIGGAVDVAFIGQTAYALVTLVGPPSVATSMVSTGWTAQTASPSSRTLAISPRRICRTLRSTFQTEFSTRWKPSVAGSWSPMGTTTACYRSHSTVRSPR